MMNYAQYSELLKSFQHEASLSLTEHFDLLCSAQDTLIANLQEKGATITGWKIVDKDGVIILSPIFDFQCFDTHGKHISSQAIRGTELEIAFSLQVPNSVEKSHDLIASLAPHAAVELIRAEIHPTNHSACDFYFNYGVFVSHKSVAGQLTFENQDSGYVFNADVAELVTAKRTVLERGVRQCIERGYGNKDYFFITGTLNGLVLSADSLGVNRVINQGNILIEFQLNEKA